MKKIFLTALIVFYGCSVSLTARERTLLEKIEAAKTVCNTASALSSKGAKSNQELAVLQEYSQITVIGNDSQYAIIANDDNFNAILGYSDNPFRHSSATNPGFTWWINAMNETIEQHIQDGTRPNYIAPSDSHKSEVSALVQTQWGQNSPYNDMTPTYIQNGVENHFVSGCVATAMAQVMKYYDYPATGNGSKSYRCTMYGSDGSPISKRLTANFSAGNYDWKNMLHVYGASYTDEEGSAVAKLMSHCGISVQMDYDISGSGSYSFRVPEAMSKYFRYSQNLRFYVRNYMNIKEWTDIIFTFLSDGHPILYGGNSKSGGHAFVIDGYDNRGLVHVNWGWNGSQDGYYDLSSLNGFSTGQEMIPVFIDDKEYEGYSSMFGTTESMRFSMFAGKLNATGDRITNCSPETFNGDFGLIAKPVGAEGKEIILAKETGTCLGYGMEFYIYSINLSFSGVELGELPDGVYRVYMATKSTESLKWEPVRSYDKCVNSAILTIAEGKASLETEADSGWTTGIENISTTDYGTSNGSMYSISGQRVDSSYRGIVIKNGRKYIAR